MDFRLRLAVAAMSLSFALNAAAEPISIAEQGSFFVGGHTIELAHPSGGFKRPGEDANAPEAPGRWVVGQAYVSYQIPVIRTKIGGKPAPAIVLLHGCCLTGKTWETTPDGREGWATYFVRKGFAVYVVDQVGRGRSGFNPASIDEPKVAGDITAVPSLPVSNQERAWVLFRFGRKFGDTNPGLMFPIEAKDQFFAQMVPDLNTWPGAEPQKATPTAVIDLLDKIGPAVLVVHSQSGTMGWPVGEARSAMLKGLIDIEGACTPAATAKAGAWSRIPFLSLWGDFIDGTRWVQLRNACRQTVAAANEAGGDAQLTTLNEVGLPGHDHMMMEDRGNLAIADWLIAWMRTHMKT